MAYKPGISLIAPPPGDVRQALPDTEAARAAGDHERGDRVRAVGGNDRQRRAHDHRLRALGPPDPGVDHLAGPAGHRVRGVQPLMLLLLFCAGGAELGTAHHTHRVRFVGAPMPLHAAQAPEPLPTDELERQCMGGQCAGCCV